MAEAVSKEALEKAALGVLCLGFVQDASADPDLLRVPEETASLVSAGAAGAILFKRNIRSPWQTARLIRALKDLAGNRPFLAAVDQEGGRVARLKGAPFAEVPPMRRVGETGDEDLAFEVGRALAASVRKVGFDVDFAPVLDVDTNPLNPVIGDRSFGRDPELVGRMGTALARGLESEGVASCAKHFPGHGDTSQDSHLTLPRLPHGLERLRQVELKPFVRYARAGLASAMSAHVVFEALDPGIPATFSHRIQTELFRGEVGFRGLLICDDLEMNAVAERWGIGEAAVRSVKAGMDLLLICHSPERQREAVEALTAAASADEGFRARLLEASRRTAAFAQRWCRRLSGDDLEALREAEALGHEPFTSPALEALDGRGTAEVASAADPTDAAHWHRG